MLRYSLFGHAHVLWDEIRKTFVMLASLYALIDLSMRAG